MEKLICPACKAENDGSAKFCAECGANIEELKKAQTARTCPECGADIADDAKFCPECGSNLEEAAQSQNAKNAYNAVRNLSQMRLSVPNAAQIKVPETNKHTAQKTLTPQTTGSRRTISRKTNNRRRQQQQKMTTF